jgi:Spy/CpxP family protein refolding chaperone
MKRLFTSALILALSIGAAQAQQSNQGKGEGHKKEHRGHQGDHKGGGFEKLNLSADQKAKMQSLKEEFKKESEALKAQENTLTAAQMKEKRKALHEKHQAQMQAILTKEQKDQVAQMKTEHKGAAHARKGEKSRFDSSARGNRDGFRGQKGAGGERGAEFAKELNLTADQKTRMQQIRTDFRSKMEAVRNNSALTQEQKRTQFQALSKAQQEQMKSILTKEQIEKMQSLRKERPARNTK